MWYIGATICIFNNKLWKISFKKKIIWKNEKKMKKESQSFCKVISLKNDQNFKSSPKIKFYIFQFYCTLNYNVFLYILYIITHLYVVKDFWSFEILKQF
jgi:hypothetical protein